MLTNGTAGQTGVDAVVAQAASAVGFSGVVSADISGLQVTTSSRSSEFTAAGRPSLDDDEAGTDGGGGDDEGEGVPIGAIVGGVIGALVMIVVVLGGIYLCHSGRKSRPASKDPSTGSPAKSSSEGFSGTNPALSRGGPAGTHAAPAAFV